MQEIKFRAWDTESMTWFEGGRALTLDWLYHVRPSVCENHLHWMQYTGLRDKNGKEIYEGDLFKPDSLVKPYCLEVKYENGSYEPFGNDPEAFSPRLGEVIGNIYEHLDLLGKE